MILNTTYRDRRQVITYPFRHSKPTRQQKFGEPINFHCLHRHSQPNLLWRSTRRSLHHDIYVTTVSFSKTSRLVSFPNVMLIQKLSSCPSLSVRSFSSHRKTKNHRHCSYQSSVSNPNSFQQPGSLRPEQILENRFPKTSAKTTHSKRQTPPCKKWDNAAQQQT